MISFLIPFHNEKESLPILLKGISSVMKSLKREFEIVLVDDGSTDDSASVVPKNQKNIVLLTHRKRKGKGRALTSAFNASSGEYIIFMDADLQDDPLDIPAFIKKIESGYDLVNGWRKTRKDKADKTLPSKIFNFLLLRLLLRSPFHDINCGFKIMRREILEEIPLYGDNYRFLPVTANAEGFKTAEVEVHHHARLYGKSKYGFWRIFYTLMDIVTHYFIFQFVEKPLHFFGPIGIVSGVIGVLTLLYYGYERVFNGMLLYRRPAVQFGILLIIVGMQIFMTGVIGELIVYLNKKNILRGKKE